MSKKFRILYLANLAAILLGLLSPIIRLIADPLSLNVVLLRFYSVLILLSVTFCISFLGLNVYGALKYRPHRARYYAVGIFLLAWIIWGTYQIVYAYVHDISL
jgi:uncharacterized membrane protein (DUF485 family)